MKQPRLELVSFDLDRTILRGRILQHLRIQKPLQEKLAALDVLFEQGKVGYEEAVQIQYSYLVGLKADEIAPQLADLSLVKDLFATAQRLRSSRVRVVILTDNPSFAVDPLKASGFDDIIGSEIEISNGVLTNRMSILTNKLEGLRHYCERNGIRLDCCAHVGDWLNDIAVFNAVGLSVAFNPSEERVSKAATYTVRSDTLLDVYRVLEPHIPIR